MTVALVLTNPEHKDFVWETILPYIKDNHIWVWDSPVRYEHWSEEYDIGISFMYTHKVPAKEVNSKPWFNFHPAPLPEYKGRDLCYWAIMNGEKEFGATIHYMSEEFDAGDIIEIKRFEILPWWTAQNLSLCANMESMFLFEKYLPLILKTPVFPRIPNVGGTYYRKGQIVDEMTVDPNSELGRRVRAVTYKQFYPRIDIGGVKYEIRRIE